MDLFHLCSKLTFCLLMWKCVFCQTLYNSDKEMYEDFNMDNKIDALQVALKEGEKRLQETTQLLHESKNAYDDLLKMYSLRTVPNDNTIDDICRRHPRLVIESSTDCHKYYNCSEVDPELGGGIGQMFNSWTARNLHECHYPFLFSNETLRCENYTDVVCGTRYEPKWACNYYRLKCKKSHCIPCERFYPKCEDIDDGLWPREYYGPIYKICQNGRTIEIGTCPRDETWGVLSFPYNGKCEHMFAIPKDYRGQGYLPSCNGTADGNFQYPERPCDAYYRCDGGIASAVKCPQNTVFDIFSKTCKVGGTCK
ncbi:chitin-binding domain protein cbd-1-like [Saccostrea cucullata]|uniref:chitin-binding domain protein cbd-1-like n=1 Tax=Saccostrea cuccullata TaxID=36930 RepID=UPI002ED15602